MTLLTHSVLRTRHITLNRSQIRHFLSSVVAPQNKNYSLQPFTLQANHMYHTRKIF